MELKVLLVDYALQRSTLLAGQGLASLHVANSFQVVASLATYSSIQKAVHKLFPASTIPHFVPASVTYTSKTRSIAQMSSLS